MTSRRSLRGSLILLLALAATLHTTVRLGADAPHDSDPAGLVRQLVSAHGSGDHKQILAMGDKLAGDAALAERVLQLLQAGASPDEAVIRAELLVRLARGQDTRRADPSRDFPTSRLGPEAAALLHDDDPFVRGLAEWALAIRLGMEYEGAEERIDGRRHYRPWPGAGAPEWYAAWAELGPDRMLEQDYVRQAAVLGWHRTATQLRESAEKLAQRARLTGSHFLEHESEATHPAVRAGLDRLEACRAALDTAVRERPDARIEHRRLWLDLRRALRDIALAAPKHSLPALVFGVRQATPGSGNITNGRWNAHTPGGDIVIKRGFEPADPVQPLLAGRLGPGHVRGLDPSWDADRLVFAYARQPDPGSKPVQLRDKSRIGGYFGQGVGEVEELSHLFEMRTDGTGLRQLTDDPWHADQEPAYLPNGDIVFVTDRSNFGSQCAGALDQDNLILNLHRCDPDGGNIVALSNNKDFDRHPHVMDNGQVLFLRWEYQERHLWNTHTLWTARPDGSMTDALYKQHIDASPMSLREARQIWGTQKLVAIACGHHNYDQGAIFVVDYGLGVNEPHGMRTLTPGASGTEGGYGKTAVVREGGVEDAGGHYMFPYPLSERGFLAAYSYKRPERLGGRNFALYYLDVWGNKELIHRDKRMSVAFVAPFRPTPRPPVIRDIAPITKEGARFAVALVADVNRGWPAEKAGQVRYLRIAQKVPWPCVEDEAKACGFNDLHWMPAAWEPVLGMWDWAPARVIGIVPVESDGSAHFKVPADQPVYFQALDENFLELRRMRSNLTFRAGEARSCVGCHESQAVSPPLATTAMPLAMRRAPSIPEAPTWGDRRIPDFEQDIQPILDRHCVQCHGEKDPDGGIELTARKIDGYMQSYRSIFALKPEDPTPFPRGYRSIWMPDQPPATDEQHAYAQAFRTTALQKPPPGQLVRIANYMGGSEVSGFDQFGSGRSRLALVLRQDELHRREVHLSRDEWISLVTWIDLNAQYWGTFVDKDEHYMSRDRTPSTPVPPRRVHVEYPDPWLRAPAGRWVWKDENTAVLMP